MERRSFLQILGMFSSATVLSSCGSEKDQKKLISYLVPPEDGVIPGEATWSFSSCQECAGECGLLVRTREGYPVKLEGLPGHPVNDGRLCMRGQAALSRLYQNERIQTPLKKTASGFEPVPWDEALNQIRQALQQEGQHLYLSGHTSGSLRSLIDRFCQRFKADYLPQFELLNQASVREANALLFRQRALPGVHLKEADLLLTLGADVLDSHTNPVDWGRQLVEAHEEPGFHWTHIESQASLTGVNADQRLALKPGSESHLLTFLLNLVVEKGGKRPLPDDFLKVLPDLSVEEAATATGLSSGDLTRLGQRFLSAKRPALVVGGTATTREEGLQTALLAGLIQWCCGMIGTTIDFGLSMATRWGDQRDLTRLQTDLETGKAGVVFLSRTGLASGLPSTHPALTALPKAKLRVGLGLTLDATLEQCDLILPIHHGLENWGDTEPRQGSYGLLKPALEPQFASRAEGDILLDLMQSPKSWQEFLFEQWEARFSQAELKRFSEQGYIEKPVKQGAYLERKAAKALQPLAPVPEELQMLLVPSVRGGDGRSYEMPLQQEIPDPLTTISWGQWLSVSPELAAEKGWQDRDMVLVKLNGWETTLPIKTQPGLPKETLCVQLGLLDSLPPITANAAGEPVLAYAVQSLTRAKGEGPLPILSGSPSQDGRGIIPDPVHHDDHHKHYSIYEEHDRPNYNWGMVVDLEKCVGCSACVAACYVENTVPIVGPEDHRDGREMSWLRIEPYYDDHGKVEFLPMMCQQCLKAPCEPVCPVYAAYNSKEGLNIQVYSRCVGTRYCANNCPYKVRRFNWFDHVPEDNLQRMKNPDLAERTKGMMEKCTFCIQRIRQAKDTAKDEERLVQDGEVIPACAQTCPAGAITFGNLLDKESKVYKLTKSKRAYKVHDLLGTDSSVTYLKPGKH